jgi:hypothetical protein
MRPRGTPTTPTAASAPCARALDVLRHERLENAAIGTRQIRLGRELLKRERAVGSQHLLDQPREGGVAQEEGMTRADRPKTGADEDLGARERARAPRHVH